MGGVRFAISRHMESTSIRACTVLFLLFLLSILGHSDATTIGVDKLQCIWFNSTESKNGILRAWKFCDDAQITEYSGSMHMDEEDKEVLAAQTTMVRQYDYLGTQIYPSIRKRYTSYESKSSCPFGVRTISTTIQPCRLEDRKNERFSRCDVGDSNWCVVPVHSDVLSTCDVGFVFCFTNAVKDEGGEIEAAIANRAENSDVDEILDNTKGEGKVEPRNVSNSLGSISRTEFGNFKNTKELHAKAMELFMHGYNMYMENAFPWDELKPLSCAPRRWDRRERGTLDDTLGGFSLTLVDSLDTLAVMGRIDDFKEGLRLIKSFVSFKRDVTISVFETVIRVLGGLLSAHMISLKLERQGFDLGYDGKFLLDLAQDLADRLLPAFDTPTGIPYHRVNLVKGVLRGETTRTCTAAAGTLILEFGTLSRLTGIPKYEKAAKNAIRAIWTRRSKDKGLVGNTIDVRTGSWLSRTASTGAGVDSFYEYLWKAYLAFEEEGYLRVFKRAYRAAQAEMKFGSWHLDVDIFSGGDKLMNGFTVSALQAFWPGMQASFGDIEEAELTHRGYFDIWKKYRAMPELFDVSRRGSFVQGSGSSYFLRPELAESTMFLYMRTKNPYYLEVGARLLKDIEDRTKVACGFAAIADVHTGRVEDRMDSYMLAETLKYLFMLFDLALPTEKRAEGSWSTWETTDLHNTSLSNIILTTEGHFIFKEYTKSKKVAQKSSGRKPQKSKQLVVNRNRADKYWASLKLEQMVLATLGEIEPLNRVDYEASILSKQVLAVEASQAAFGIPFGDSPTQYILVYADPPEGCSKILNSDEIGNAIKASTHLRSRNGLKTKAAVLVDRGKCSFMEKMQNLGSAGAEIVFVVNSENMVLSSSGIASPVVSMQIDEKEIDNVEMLQLLASMRALMLPFEIRPILHQTARSLWGGTRNLFNSSHHVVIELPSRDLEVKGKKIPRNEKSKGVYPIDSLLNSQDKQGALASAFNTILGGLS